MTRGVFSKYQNSTWYRGPQTIFSSVICVLLASLSSWILIYRKEAIISRFRSYQSSITVPPRIPNTSGISVECHSSASPPLQNWHCSKSATQTTRNTLYFARWMAILSVSWIVFDATQIRRLNCISRTENSRRLTCDKRSCYAARTWELMHFEAICC